VSVSELGITAGDVGDAGSRTVVQGLNDPPPRGDTVKIEDDGSAPEKIIEYLAEKKVL
jgi:electron transfer flavoprotein alpha/beta subunit